MQIIRYGMVGIVWKNELISFSDIVKVAKFWLSQLSEEQAQFLMVRASWEGDKHIYTQLEIDFEDPFTILLWINGDHAISNAAAKIGDMDVFLWVYYGKKRDQKPFFTAAENGHFALIEQGHKLKLVTQDTYNKIKIIAERKGVRLSIDKIIELGPTY